MSTTRRHLRTALALAAVASATAFLAGCSTETPSGDAAAGETTTLKVATLGLLADGALQLGIEQGFFEAEGLEIETSIVANPPAGLAAAQSGQVDLAYTPSIPLLNALSQGIELRVVQAADGYPDGSSGMSDLAEIDDTALYASPASGITSVDELAGATIAVPARNAQLEVTITDVLQNAGIDPSSINWVVLDFTSAVAALKSGNVDAAGLVSPFTDLAAQSGAALVSSPAVEFFEEGAVGLWAAGAGTVDAKPAAIAGFARAIAQSNAYANEHPEAAIQAGIDYTESSLSVEEATVPYWPTEVAQSDLPRVNDKLVALGFLTAAVDLDGIVLEARR